jgi:hypothetical protein
MCGAMPLSMEPPPDWLIGNGTPSIALTWYVAGIDRELCGASEVEHARSVTSVTVPANDSQRVIMSASALE